jgi:hypothetical protein
VRQPVQRVIDVENRLALAVGLADQVAYRVIQVALAQRGREGGLRDPAKSVVGELRGVPGGIGNAEQVVLRVIGVAGDVARGIRDGDQPVSIVISIAGDLAVLVRDRSPAATEVIGSFEALRVLSLKYVSRP